MLVVLVVLKLMFFWLMLFSSNEINNPNEFSELFLLHVIKNYLLFLITLLKLLRILRFSISFINLFLKMTLASPPLAWAATQRPSPR